MCNLREHCNSFQCDFVTFDIFIVVYLNEVFYTSMYVRIYPIHINLCKHVRRIVDFVRYILYSCVMSDLFVFDILTISFLDLLTCILMEAIVRYLKK